MVEDVKKFWFQMPDLEGRVVHVTSRDELDLLDTNLGVPFLVAAVPEEDHERFRSFSIDERVSYADENGCIGHWVPDDAFYDYIRSLFPEVYEFRDSLRRMPPEERAREVALFLYNRISLHSSLSSKECQELLWPVGFSSMAVVSVLTGVGNCFPKTSLGVSLYGDAVPVGFRNFDLDIWRDVCDDLPPFVLTENGKYMPPVYNNSFFQSEIVGNRSNLEYLKIPPGIVINLHPDHPSPATHFWPEVQVKGSDFMIETRRKNPLDPYFDYLKEKVEMIKKPCATCLIQDNVVVDYGPK